MQDSFGGRESTRRKAEAVSDAINKLLQNLVIKCAKSEGVRDYYHTGVIGYGDRVGPAFLGQLSGKEMASISEIANLPARVEERSKKVDDGAGGLVEQRIKFPIWFDAVASNGTPMCKAFAHAKGVVSSWISQHPDCFPPIVINITDGESTDGDPAILAKEITALRRNEWVEFASRGGRRMEWYGYAADPSIFLLQDPEVSIWALQKEDASNRLPLPSSWR